MLRRLPPVGTKLQWTSKALRLIKKRLTNELAKELKSMANQQRAKEVELIVASPNDLYLPRASDELIVIDDFHVKILRNKRVLIPRTFKSMDSFVRRIT